MDLRRKFLLPCLSFRESKLTGFVANSRRTHQSGPLGELFDHGVDALNTSLEVLIFAASQNMGQGWMTVGILFSCT